MPIEKRQKTLIAGFQLPSGKSMIDWLVSKIGTLIAIGIITGFVLSLFAWQHGVMVDREGQLIADSISERIDSLAGLEAAISVDVGFGNEPEQLPVYINGKEYNINITTNMVIITQGNRQWISSFIEPIICQNLSERQFNLTSYDELITDAYAVIPSGQDFCIERASIDISGEIKYISLVYIN